MLTVLPSEIMRKMFRDFLGRPTERGKYFVVL